MLTYLISALFVLITVAVYLYFYFRRVIDFWGIRREKKKVKRLALLITIALCLWSFNPFGFGALFVLHMVGAAFVMEIINFVYGKLRRKYRNNKKGIWTKVFYSGLVPIIMSALILILGYFNMENVRETDYTIHTGKVIREQGYRIALIADVHFGTTMTEEKLKEYCSEIEGKKPDLVVLCGDIVDSNTKLTQMENAFKILSGIKSSYGTFYVYGNHDKRNYGMGRNFTEEQLNNALSSNGIHVLEDEIYNMNDELTIIGRRDRGFSSDQKRKTTEELVENINTKSFLLLLDHQPSEYDKNSAAGIDLELSGHTHGGQFWPEGLLNEHTGIGDLNYGYEKRNNFQAIVTSGIGGYGYPIRTGSISEYVIVDVKR